MTIMANPPGTPVPRFDPWILGAWRDQVLIIATPLLIVPVVFLMGSPFVAVPSETIGLIVAAFFAVGHHLPGLIRAYGDRELFSRFRLRFVLAPPILFAAFFPLHLYHPHLIRLTLLVWATWHGLMQLYARQFRSH
jgi:hypothetical protein